MTAAAWPTARSTTTRQAATVTAFTGRALDWFLEHGIVAERLMSDNAFTYTQNKTLKALLHARAIDHLRTRPYTPRTNGKVERYQQTLQREWAYAMQYASSDARRASLPHWVRHYNERRTHSALGNRPPITAFGRSPGSTASANERRCAKAPAPRPCACRTDLMANTPQIVDTARLVVREQTADACSRRGHDDSKGALGRRSAAHK